MFHILDFSQFYLCFIYQQTICTKVIAFDYALIPVMKIVSSIPPKATQVFKVLLEELSAEYADLLLTWEFDGSAGAEYCNLFCHFWEK